VEHLSDASFLAKVQEFPANVRLGWPSTNALAYLASILVTQKKTYITLTTESIITTLHFLRSL